MIRIPARADYTNFFQCNCNCCILIITPAEQAAQQNVSATAEVSTAAQAACQVASVIKMQSIIATRGDRWPLWPSATSTTASRPGYACRRPSMAVRWRTRPAASCAPRCPPSRRAENRCMTRSGLSSNHSAGWSWSCPPPRAHARAAGFQRMIPLDTNVISELFKLKPKGRVAAWIAGQPAAALFTSTVTRGELLRGQALA